MIRKFSVKLNNLSKKASHIFLICLSISVIITPSLNTNKINEDLSYAGYNLLVTPELISFIREYNVTETPEKNYINNAIRSDTYLKIKRTLGLSKLGNLYLTKKNLDNLLNDVDLNTSF